MTRVLIVAAAIVLGCYMCSSVDDDATAPPAYDATARHYEDMTDRALQDQERNSEALRDYLNRH